jgi:hypothetical protein
MELSEIKISIVLYYMNDKEFCWQRRPGKIKPEFIGNDFRRNAID